MLRSFSGLLVAVGLAGLLFFSLRPAPMNAGRTAGLPGPVAQWLNAHDHLANFLAFAALGTFGVLFARRRAPASGGSRQRANGKYGRTAILCLLALLAAGLEVAQLLIPGRVCDLKDILAAWAGLLSVWFVVQTLCRLDRSV